MVYDDTLDDVAATVDVLIREELDIQHRLGQHPTPAPGCAACRSTELAAVHHV